MKVVVQKFGGTCVESRANQERSAQRIIDAWKAGRHPVVVVSAMGREGQPYATAELVKIVKAIDPKIEPRELDLLMSCGEIISTVAMAHLLKSKGYRTVALAAGQAGLITDHYHGAAEIIRIDPHQVLASLDEGRIVFVTGFQGVTQRGHAITTLGQGGSDYTAIALAASLSERPQLSSGEELQVMPVEIYKDVPGVMTADPKSLRGAQGRMLSQPITLPTIPYQELPVLARLGADIIQHKAAQMAADRQIPLVILPYAQIDGPQTRISPRIEADHDRAATLIADIANLVLVRMADGEKQIPQALAKALVEHRITHHVIPTDRGMSVAVKAEKYRDIPAMVTDTIAARALPARLSRGQWALVSAVGQRVGQPEITARAEKALQRADITPSGTAVGSMSISYLVRDTERKPAVVALHKELIRS